MSGERNRKNEETKQLNSPSSLLVVGFFLLLLFYFEPPAANSCLTDWISKISSLKHLNAKKKRTR